MTLQALAGSLAHATPADEVHWTLIGQTAISFDWRGGSDSLFYGVTATYDSLALASAPSVLPFSSPGPFREAKLTGLVENTLYHYRIGAEGTDHTFRTPPPHGTTGFRFVVQGDVGATKDWARIPSIQAAVAASNPRFVLMIGDLTYGNSIGQASVDAHFNDMMVWSQDAAYQPAWGNHEWESPAADDMANYKGRFDLPNQQASPGAPASGCCGEDWSWFDYGNVRFIAYPEPFLGAWTDWQTKATPIFDAAQADPNIKFIVTFGHRPAFSSGYHSGEPTLEPKLAALRASHSKYVLNLNGHSHDYERSYAQLGLVHVTAGTGGSHLEENAGSCKWDGGCPAPVWSAYRAMHHVVVYFDVGANSIVGTVICGPADPVRNDMACTEGTILETFSVPGADFPPIVTAPASASSVEGSQMTVSVQAAEPNGDAVQALTAEQLPAGAVFTTAGNKLSGTLTWTPGAGTEGDHVVVFRASNALDDTAATTITVSNVNQPPVAAVSVGPATGNAPLSVVANASATVDPEGAASFFQFDFGDGTYAGPQLGSSVNHTYLAGDYDLKVLAYDPAGLSDTASAHVIVAPVYPGPNLTTNASFESSSSGWGPYGGSTIAVVAGGFDGAQACSTMAGAGTASFGINDSPNGVTTTSGVGSRYRFTAWVRSPSSGGAAKLRVTEYVGVTKIGSTIFSNPAALSPQWKPLVVDFITGAAGSTLDLQVVDYPLVVGEKFIVDNIAIHDITGSPVGVGDPPGLGESRAWVTPMPITARGSLQFVTPRGGPVQVEIFDLSGRRMLTPIAGSYLGAGLHAVPLGGAGAPLRAGLYLYRIRFDRGSLQGRFVVAR